MAKRGDDPSGQSWGTFLRNHMPHIAAIDLFVVPTIGFRLLYALVIVRLARRELVWINVMLAERLCGTTDRHNPAGLRRPLGRVRGGTPASGPHQVRRLL
jgi:hypothetical protein